jgi:hypothetical protein
MVRSKGTALVVWALAGCGGSGGATLDAGPAADAAIACDPQLEYTGTFPAGAEPCTDAVRWPLALRSEALPVVVHYARCEHSGMAARVLGLVEHAWEIETGVLGFSAPLPDGGACGEDDAFDVYLWPDAVESYVQALEPNPDTAHDDWLTFMVLDPWGPYGGDLLGSTIAHELNHACQATDDWWEHVAAFELTATFVEEIVHPDANQWLFVLDDFQAHPDWSVDRDDDYETWYMYGASLLLHLVRERYFAGDPGFAGAMWHRSRNPPGDNEPDFQDALGAVLHERAGVGFADAVGELAAWRWYTGERADGTHFADGALYPRPVTAATVTTASASVSIEPMIYGTAYIDVVGTGERPIELVAAGTPGVRWLVQALPGTAGATRDLLDPAGDILSLDGFDLRTVAITALPLTERDPDDQADERFAATLIVGQ